MEDSLAHPLVAQSASKRASRPSSKLGLTAGPWRWARALATRLFADRERVPEVWAELYRRAWINPILENNAAHECTNAF